MKRKRGKRKAIAETIERDHGLETESGQDLAIGSDLGLETEEDETGAEIDEETEAERDTETEAGRAGGTEAETGRRGEIVQEIEGAAIVADNLEVGACNPSLHADLSSRN